VATILTMRTGYLNLLSREKYLSLGAAGMNPARSGPFTLMQHGLYGHQRSSLSLAFGGQIVLGELALSVVASWRGGSPGSNAGDSGHPS